MSNWLTGIIVLLIVVILVDGFRRTWNARRNRIGVSPSLRKRTKNIDPVVQEEKEAPPSYISELPNGGARVIGYRDPLDTPLPETTFNPKDAKETRRPEVKRPPEQTRLNLDRSVPILMESVEHKSDSANHYQNADDDEHPERIEPIISTSEQDDTYHHEKNTLHAERDHVHEDDEEYEEDELDDDEYDEDLNEDLNDEELNEYSRDDEGYDEDYEDDEEYDDDDEDDDEFDEDDVDATPLAAAPQSDPEEVLIINVMAHKGEVFKGLDLLDIVLKCGLRYGSMDIFHRYSDTKGEGALLFSMANMVKPGTFDLDAMDEFTTPGVSLFMTLPIDADSMQSFELMVETAQAISQTLHGELKDEQRSAMTRQTIEHSRQRISDFERKKLFRRPK